MNKLLNATHLASGSKDNKSLMVYDRVNLKYCSELIVNYLPLLSEQYKQDKYYLRLLEDGKVVVEYNKELYLSYSIYDIFKGNKQSQRELAPIEYRELAYMLECKNSFKGKLLKENMFEQFIFLGGKFIYKILDSFKNSYLIYETLDKALIYCRNEGKLYKVPRVVIFALQENGYLLNEDLELNHDGTYKAKPLKFLVDNVFNPRNKYVQMLQRNEIPEDFILTMPKDDKITINDYLNQFINISYIDSKPELCKYKCEYFAYHNFIYDGDREYYFIEVQCKLDTRAKDLDDSIGVKEDIDNLIQSYCFAYGLHKTDMFVGNIKYISISRVLLIPIILPIKELKEPHIINPLWED